MSLNLHNIVGEALTVVNDWQDLVFTKTTVEWLPSSREPVKTQTKMTVRGKIQPASLQELRETGFNLQEYQYFKVFITGDPTQLDRLRQFGSDTFICQEYTYQVVAKEAWDDAGWREAYAYRVDYEGENDGNASL
nr:MAG TPA: hypothetical protein [Caudoviricetes sp.]